MTRFRESKSQQNQFRPKITEIGKENLKLNQNTLLPELTAEGRETLRTATQMSRSKMTVGSAIISQQELQRIKLATKFQSTNELNQDQSLQIQKDKIMALSQARKSTIIGHERNKSTRVPLQPLPLDQQQNINTIWSRAQALLDEEEDDVKTMNRMILYSKSITIRDKQLIENQRLEQEYIENQRKLDKMMEIERLKDSMVQAERKKLRKEAAIVQGQVIVDQIQERDLERQRHKEILEMEKLQMLRNIAAAKQSEIEEKRIKTERNKSLMSEIEASNRIAIEKRQQKVNEEKAHEAEIHQWQLRKIQKEIEAANEVALLNAEKEREVQRQREAQEKASNRLAEIDEQKAKKAYEEHERRLKEWEKKQAERQAKAKQELDDARKKQFSDKDSRLMEQAAAERANFIQLIAKQKEDEEQERIMLVEKRAALLRHKMEVVQQIEKNKVQRNEEKMSYFDERRQVEQALQQRREKIRSIQQAKLQELNQYQIDQKYKLDLENKKVSF